MGSEAKGILRVLTWFDSVSDELKALINDDGEMPVKVENFPNILDIRQHSYDRWNWVKDSLPLGYSGRWAEAVINGNASAGTNILTTQVVPTGFVYSLQGMSSVNWTSGSDHKHFLILYGLSCFLRYEAIIGPGAHFGSYPVSTLMIPGDYVRVEFHGCTAGDSLYVTVWGMKTKTIM